jgi:hypothetical protein
MTQQFPAPRFVANVEPKSQPWLKTWLATPEAQKLLKESKPEVLVANRALQAGFDGDLGEIKSLFAEFGAELWTANLRGVRLLPLCCGMQTQFVCAGFRAALRSPARPRGRRALSARQQAPN